MVNEHRNGSRYGVAAPADINLVTLSGVAFVNAAPEPALEVARTIGGAFPGGTPCLFVVDCQRLSDGQMAFALGWYLSDGSRGRVSGSLVLLREVQALSPSNQLLLAQLIAGRRRGDAAVRVVASSSIDLYQRVLDDTFDAGLYYLLNMVTLTPRRGALTRPRASDRQSDMEGDPTGSSRHYTSNRGSQGS